MEAQDVFLTIAEISVAFAGFSGVVAVFGRRSPDKWRSGDILRFWQMIEVSLSALIFSLLPFILHYIGLPDASTWATCSALLAVISSVQMARAGFRTVKAAGTDPSIKLGFTIPFLLIGFVIVLFQVGNTVGIVFHRELAPYLIGVFWQLSLACVLFWRLLKYSDLPNSDLKRNS